MTDAIGSVSSNSVASSSGKSASKISEETKKKLEALGLDPSKYTSEAAAQAAITAAKAAQAAAAQNSQQQGGSDSIKTIEQNAKDLAVKMGVAVGNNDKLNDVLDKIATKIDELDGAAGTDATKKAELADFKSQFQTLSTEFNEATAAQNMTGATALGNYNKAALSL